MVVLKIVLLLTEEQQIVMDVLVVLELVVKLDVVNAQLIVAQTILVVDAQANVEDVLKDVLGVTIVAPVAEGLVMEVVKALVLQLVQNNALDHALQDASVIVIMDVPVKK